MKALVIGNSHASALQLALREGWSRPGLDIDILVIPGRRQPEMRRTGDLLFPSGNPKHIRSNFDQAKTTGFDIRDYQAIWLIGFGLNGPNTGTLADRSHTFARANHLLGQPQMTIPRVSRGVMKQMIAADIQATGFLPLIATLREYSAVEIYVVPRPRLSVKIFKEAEGELQALFGDHAVEALAAFLPLHDEVVAEIIPAGIPILWQDPSTQVGLFTAPRFNLLNDFTHMNRDYGALVLDSLVGRCCANHA